MVKLITVIFNELEMEKVELVLAEHETTSYSFYKVKGRGRHYNAFSNDPLTEHVKMEIYLPSTDTDAISNALTSALNNTVFGDGLISICDISSLTMFERYIPRQRDNVPC